MFYSLTRILGAPAIMSWLCLPAAAAELAPESHDAVYYGLRVLLITISLIIGAYYAHGAFERPIVTPEDGPAPPRYMTQPRQYRMGMIAYMGLCLVAYALIVGYYKDLAPFLELAAPPEIRPAVDAAINQSALSFPVVVVLAVVALAAFLKIEREWNPLFALRRVVWGWVSIPELANHIMSAALSGLVVPPNERENIAREPGNHVDSGDFDKDRQSVDRNWAELCYLRLWLTRNREAGSHFTFFNEPSLGWHDLENDYKKMRDQIAPLQALRPDSGFGAEIFAETATKIEKLRRRYCRLAACFIVFKTDTKKAAVRDAERFGATFAGPIEARRNPMRYVVLFVVAILISINLGVWLSATMWDLTHPAAAASAAASALDKDANITTRWSLGSL
jgi:hypothetical protein